MTNTKKQQSKRVRKKTFANDKRIIYFIDWSVKGALLLLHFTILYIHTEKVQRLCESMMNNAENKSSHFKNKISQKKTNNDGVTNRVIEINYVISCHQPRCNESEKSVWVRCVCVFLCIWVCADRYRWYKMYNNLIFCTTPCSSCSNINFLTHFFFFGSLILLFACSL